MRFWIGAAVFLVIAFGVALSPINEYFFFAAYGILTAVVLATAANSEAMAATVGGLGPQGELVIIGVTADNLPISPLDLINSGLSVTGHPSGTARDVEETMAFAVQSGVRAVIEERPLAQAAEAYAAMDAGKARYRMVLTV
jgi:alcohol dehydrogenase